MADLVSESPELGPLQGPVQDTNAETYSHIHFLPRFAAIDLKDTYFQQHRSFLQFGVPI